MITRKALFAAVLSLGMLTGCAPGLNSQQKREYNAMKADNMLVEEKNPATGGWLGILPGGGSFYAREPIYGVLNLLLWPISIFWDPVSGYEGSMAINYEMSLHAVKRAKEKDLSDLEYRQARGEVDDATFAMEKRSILQKYSFY